MAEQPNNQIESSSPHNPNQDPAQTKRDRRAIVRVFDKPANVRILDYMTETGMVEQTAKEIADGAGVGVSTFHQNIDLLVECGLIEVAGETAGATVYTGPAADEPFKRFLQLQRALGQHLYEDAGTNN